MRIAEERLPLSVEELRRHYTSATPVEGWEETTRNATQEWRHPDAEDVYEQMKEVAAREDRGVYVMDIDRHLHRQRFPIGGKA